MSYVILRWLLCLPPSLVGVGAFGIFGTTILQHAYSLLFALAIVLAGSIAESYVKIIVDKQPA